MRMRKSAQSRGLEPSTSSFKPFDVAQGNSDFGWHLLHPCGSHSRGKYSITKDASTKDTSQVPTVGPCKRPLVQTKKKALAYP